MTSPMCAMMRVGEIVRQLSELDQVRVVSRPDDSEPVTQQWLIDVGLQKTPFNPNWTPWRGDTKGDYRKTAKAFGVRLMEVPQ